MHHGLAGDTQKGETRCLPALFEEAGWQPWWAAWILAWTILGAMPVAPPGGHREGWKSMNLWSGVAPMLTMIGLTGAHLRQVRRIGGIGHARFVLPWTGTAPMGAGRLGQLVEIGGAWILVILGAFALTIGIVLFGIATLRARRSYRPQRGF